MRCYQPHECSQMFKVLTARANRRHFVDLWPGLAPNKEQIDIMTLAHGQAKKVCKATAGSDTMHCQTNLDVEQSYGKLLREAQRIQDADLIK